MSAPVVEIDRLSLYYGNFRAVDDFSLTIGQGEVCGFIGPNGAGKTSTMRVMASLMLPTYGAVRIMGLDVAARPREVKRRIGFMPDFFGVYDNLKVWEYLDFFGSVYGVAAGEVKRRIGEVLELTALSGKRDNYVEELSRGMKQRLCLAKTLMHDPELLILDEPASGLDPKARIEIRDLLRQLAARGKTIFVSSHIISELEDMCTHVAIIELGRLIKAGPVGAIGGESAARVLRARLLFPEAGEAALAGREEVLAMERQGAVLRITIPDQDQAAARVVEALVTGGAGPVAVETEKPTLSESFMKVTSGRVQ